MMLATPLEDVLFRSVETALYFAFSEQYIDLPQSPVSRMASKPSRAGNGLGGLDGYAQAGMILSSMGDLCELHRHILTARFSPPIRGDCPHCSGGVIHNKRWLTAIDAIADFVGQEVQSSKTHKRLREGIVRRHFGDKVRLIEIAKACGIHANTASNHGNKILSILKTQEKQARFEIRAVLESSGVVGN